MPRRTGRAIDHADWMGQVLEWQKEHPLSWAKGDVLKPQQVVERMYEITKGEAIITTEVGQNQMWAAQFYKYHKPRTYLTSGGLGTMGYGLPAAIGAQMAFPDRSFPSASPGGVWTTHPARSGPRPGKPTCAMWRGKASPLTYHEIKAVRDFPDNKARF